MRKKVTIKTPYGEGTIAEIWVSELNYLMVKVYFAEQKKWISFNLSTHDVNNNMFTKAINKKDGTDDLSLDYDDLPQDVKDEMFKRHSHAEIEFESNPDKIVYTEKHVIELLNFIKNRK